MPLIKMATAARRARVGSTNTIRRALVAAGVPLVTISPGVFAVEEHDLSRFLENRQKEPKAPPKSREQASGDASISGASPNKPKKNGRRQ